MNEVGKTGFTVGVGKIVQEEATENWEEYETKLPSKEVVKPKLKNMNKKGILNNLWLAIKKYLLNNLKAFLGMSVVIPGEKSGAETGINLITGRDAVSEDGSSEKTVIDQKFQEMKGKVLQDIGEGMRKIGDSFIEDSALKMPDAGHTPREFGPDVLVTGEDKTKLAETEKKKNKD